MSRIDPSQGPNKAFSETGPKKTDLSNGDNRANRVFARQFSPEKTPTPTKRTWPQKALQCLKGILSQTTSLKKEALSSFEKKPLYSSDLSGYIKHLFSQKGSVFEASRAQELKKPQTEEYRHEVGPRFCRLLNQAWNTNTVQKRGLSPQGKLEAFAKDKSWQEDLGSTDNPVNLTKEQRMKFIEAASDTLGKGAKVTRDIKSRVAKSTKEKELQVANKQRKRARISTTPEKPIHTEELKPKPIMSSSIDVLVKSLQSQTASDKTIFDGSPPLIGDQKRILNLVYMALGKTYKEGKTGEDQLKLFAEDNLWNESIGRSDSPLFFTKEQKNFFVEEAARFLGTNVPPDMK